MQQPVRLWRLLLICFVLATCLLHIDARVYRSKALHPHVATRLRPLQVSADTKDDWLPHYHADEVSETNGKKGASSHRKSTTTRHAVHNGKTTASRLNHASPSTHSHSHSTKAAHQTHASQSSHKGHAPTRRPARPPTPPLPPPTPRPTHRFAFTPKPTPSLADELRQYQLWDEEDELTEQVIESKWAVSLGSSAVARFTGTVPFDFAYANDRRGLPGLFLISDESDDVRLPPQWPYAAGGWDIINVAVLYDTESDNLFIGIECKGICGDADGDGDPSRTSEELKKRGGRDLANLGGTESFAIAFDVGVVGRPDEAPDGHYDLIVGYPAAESRNGHAFACNVSALDVRCLSVAFYDAHDDIAQRPLSEHFFVDQSEIGGGLARLMTVRDRNWDASVSRPHLEWSVPAFGDMLRAMGFGSPDREGVREWRMAVRVYAGSGDDDGIGADHVGPAMLHFDCFTFDECGVCGGTGDTCRDCRGEPNGGAQLDVCGVCEGDGSTCADCAGVPMGSSVLDRCGVCDGADACVDCEGVPHGDADYDECNVCNGDGTSCQVWHAGDRVQHACALAPGNQFRGAFHASPLLGALHGRLFTLTIAGHSYATWSVPMANGCDRTPDDLERYARVSPIAGALEAVGAQPCEPRVNFGRWAQRANHLIIQDLAGRPNDAACTTEAPGEYRMYWSGAAAGIADTSVCETLMLCLHQDPCATRRSLFAGPGFDAHVQPMSETHHASSATEVPRGCVRLHRYRAERSEQRATLCTRLREARASMEPDVRSLCALESGDVLKGAYDHVVLSSGRRVPANHEVNVTLVFGSDGALIETSSAGAHFSVIRSLSSTLNGRSVHHLSQVRAVPREVQCEPNASAEAAYTLEWSQRCESVQWNAKDDACAHRHIRLHTLALRPSRPVCAPRVGRH